jgi:hypothetical protein
MRALPIWLVIILAVSLALGASVLTRGHDWGDDWASYVMQAQSILNGTTHEFIARNTFTIFESSFQIGPVAYPWGYPLLLTPALLLKGVHALTLKLPGLFLFAGFLICLFWLTKDRLAPTESLPLVSLFAFNPTLILYLDQIISDIPFLFFIFLGLWWLNRSRSTLRDNLLLGTFIFLAAFVRTTGIILLAAYLAHQGLNFLHMRSSRKPIIVQVTQVILAFVVLWLVSSLLLPNGQGAYFEQLKGLTPEIFRGNISYYYSLFPQFFGNASIWTMVFPVFAAFFLTGAITRRSADQALWLFFVLYLTAMIFWPERQGIRFIFPVLPLFMYFVFQGVHALLQFVPFSGKLAVDALWLALIGFFLYHSGMMAYTNLKDDRAINGPFDKYSQAVYEFIKTDTPPDSVIIFWKPRAMRLFTDRDSLMSTECARLPLGDYAVISKKAEHSQISPDQIDECGLSPRTVFENQRFIIYELPK